MGETLPPGAIRCAGCRSLFMELDGSRPPLCLDCRRQTVQIGKAEFTRDLLLVRARALREVMGFCETQLREVNAALDALPPEQSHEKS